MIAAGMGLNLGASDLKEHCGSCGSIGDPRRSRHLTITYFDEF